MPIAMNQNVAINYEVSGQGLPLVLMHGNVGSLQDWKHLGYIEKLSQNYQVIAIDARGHGQSSKLYDPAEYTLQKRAADVICVLNALHIEQANYLGFSMGGWIGYGLLQYYSERLSSTIIAGAHPYGSSSLVNVLKEWLAAGMPRFIENIENTYGPMPDAIKNDMLHNDVKALIAANTLARTDISSILHSNRNIFPPRMLYVGDFDPIRDQVKKTAELLNANYFVVPKANHVQTLWWRDAVLQPIEDFLAKVV